MTFIFTNHTRFDIYRLWRNIRDALETLEVPTAGTFTVVSQTKLGARKQALDGLEQLYRTERLDLIEGSAILNAIGDLLQYHAAGEDMPRDLLLKSYRGAERHLGTVAISEMHHRQYVFKTDETPLDDEKRILRSALKVNTDLYNGETHSVDELASITKKPIDIVRRILCRWIDDGLAYVPHSAIDEEKEIFQLDETAQSRLGDTYTRDRAKTFKVTVEIARPFPANTMSLAEGIAIELGAHSPVKVHHASTGILVLGTLPEDSDPGRADRFAIELKEKIASAISEEQRHEFPIAHAENNRHSAEPSNVAHSVAQEHPSPLAIRRQILEELYELNARSSQATRIWSAERDDPVSIARAREAEYLKERMLVSGVIGAHGDISLKLTADGRDFVEAGGFWSKAVAHNDKISADPPEHKLPRMEVTYGEMIGSGAFGTVWQATDVLLARDIAVKFLTSTDQIMDENALIREARSLAKITHPNLVAVYAAAWLRHPQNKLLAPALVMEFLPGETMDKWWSISHSHDKVFRVASGLVAGVIATHAASLVHGDLHPGNIMVLPDSRTKLIDWRYNDTSFQRSSSHRQHEMEAERRRVMDLLDTLFEKQGLDTERAEIRRMTTLTEVAAALQIKASAPTD